jgi:hypothetical protein
MKLSLTLLAICFLFCFATCSPLTVWYRKESSYPLKNNALLINGGEQQLYLSFYQKHYIGNHAEHFFQAKLENYSSDTLFLIESLPLLTIICKNNTVDVHRLNEQLLSHEKYVLPNSDVLLSASYRTENISVKKFFQSVKGEEIKVNVRYKVGHKMVLADSIRLISSGR